MTQSRSLAERLARFTGRLGFWFPLLVCTYLALIPDPPDNPVFRLSDVILHAAAFTYLTFAYVLMGAVLRRTAGAGPGWLVLPSGRLALEAVGVMLFYGLFLEAVQSLIPERSAELKDLAVDVVGITTGLLLAVLFARPVASLLHLLSSRMIEILPIRR